MSVFRDCSGLTSLIIKEGVESIGNSAFRYAGIESLVIPGSAQFVGSYAFANNKNLTSVTLGEGVLAIGNQTFAGCESLKSATLPSSLICIGEKVFDGDTNLSSIYSFAVIPPECTDYVEGSSSGLGGMFVKSKKHDMWGTVALHDSDLTETDESTATNMSKAISMNMNEPTSSGDSFILADSQVTGNCTLYVPQESVEDYKVYDSWRDFTHVEGFDPTGIKDIKDITASDSDAKSQRIYNLNGIRLSKPQPGLNIINGRKVVVK